VTASKLASRSTLFSLFAGLLFVALLGWRIASMPDYTFARIVQDFLNALTLGSLYALIALGYTMVYGIIRLINFAHGEIFMLGSYFAFYAMTLTPMHWGLALLTTVLLGGTVLLVLRSLFNLEEPKRTFVLALLIFGGTFFLLAFRHLGWIEALLLSMLATGVAGVLLDLVAYRPLRGAPRESMLITAIAASFFLQNMGQLIFGPRLRGFHVETVLNQTLSLQIGTEKVYFTGILLVVPVITALLLAILNYFVTAAAGVMYAIRFGQINPLMGLLPGIKAFTAAVIGGIGSLPGAVLGGLLLGFIEIYVVSLFPGLTAYKDVFAFVLLILILLFKPSGLIGEDLTEKV